MTLKQAVELYKFNNKKESAYYADFDNVEAVGVV